jgi:hypothetical protein
LQFDYEAGEALCLRASMMVFGPAAQTSFGAVGYEDKRRPGASSARAAWGSWNGYGT